MKVKQRIQLHYDHGVRDYYDLLLAVFPEKDYPKSWGRSCNGGPPGCAMAFGKALREMGGLRYNNKIYIEVKR